MPLINEFIVLGDSLSERGTMKNRKLFGFIPMEKIAGLENSPSGRYTNGYSWSDAAANWFIQDSIIKNAHKNGLDDTDIADAIIAKDCKFYKTYALGYSFDDDKKINYDHRNVFRSYAEGGLTSYDYSWVLSSSIIRFIKRLILSNLEEKREELAQDDRKNKKNHQAKQHTLVMEWSGANDLITVNKEPGFIEAERAVDARIKNVKHMISMGYQNFILFNLPDLSLTPRYQRKSKKEQESVQAVTHYFNERLAKEMEQLQNCYLHCYFSVFDVNYYFIQAWNDPETYGFDPDKKTKSYVESDDFVLENATEEFYKHAKVRPDHTISPSDGYFFWDGIHPTADLHAKIAEFFYLKYQNEFILKVNADNQIMNTPAKALLDTPCKKIIDIPAQKLFDSFMTLYLDKINHECRKNITRFSIFQPKSRLLGKLVEINKKSLPGKDQTQQKLNIIFDHAINDKGERAKCVLQELGWYSENNVIPIYSLIEALNYAHSERVKLDRSNKPSVVNLSL